MQDTRKISLCLTNYNRYELLIKAFEQVLNDDRVSEIVIRDDCSDWTIWDKIVEYQNSFFNVNKKYFDKIFLLRNGKNIGMSQNKTFCIDASDNNFCIIFDSDNILTSDYIDQLYKIPVWNPDTIYSPSGALPNFDYSFYAGETITKDNAKNWIGKQLDFDCLMNTGNYFVNRDHYVNTYQYNPDIKEADTIWHNYNHLKNDGKIYVVPGMTYQHLVHDGSGWMVNREENNKKANEIKELIRQL